MSSAAGSAFQACTYGGGFGGVAQVGQSLRVGVQV